jgi:sRNA-binding carbon storage regulator CsrA
VLTHGETRIEIVTLEMNNSRVRLGFQAGPEVAINRGEVQAKIDEEAETRVQKL